MTEESDAQLEARFVWARRRGHPRWVWPELDPRAWREGLERIEGVLRAALAGDAPMRLEGTAADALAVGVAAFSSGTGALLGRWWEQGALDTDPGLGAALLLHLDHGRRRWTRLRGAAAHATDVLASAGYAPVLLKGIHTAGAFFPEPGCRPADDVDLCVPAGALGAALAALERAGYAVLNRQTALGRAELRPAGEGASLRSVHLLHADAPVRIDVHAGLDRDFFGVGRLALGEPGSADVQPWPAVHPRARVLRQPLLLLTLAGHASEGLHNLTLLRLYELVAVIRVERAAGRLDWDALLGRVPRAQYRFLFPALETAERLAPGSVPAQVRSALRAESPPALRRVVEGLRPAHAQRVERLSLEERLMWAGTPGELLGRLRDMAWPASAGGSWRRAGRIYAERFWRVVRARVTLGE